MSIKITPKINIDAAGIAMRIKNSIKKSMPELCDQILTDCNQYAPYRSGNLVGKSIINAYTEDNKEEIVWGDAAKHDVPYASYVYKGISRKGKLMKYTKDTNQNAGSHWCKRAKDIHLGDWKKMLGDKVKDNYKNG